MNTETVSPASAPAVPSDAAADRTARVNALFDEATAHLALGLGGVGEGMKCLAAGIALDPKRADLVYLAAEGAGLIGDLSTAKQFARRAIELDPAMRAQALESDLLRPIQRWILKHVVPVRPATAAAVDRK